MNDDRWVLFDLDGTLTKSEEGIWNCVKYAAEKMNFAVPPQEILDRFIGPPLFYSFRTWMGMTEEQAEQAIVCYRERYTTVGLYENRVYPGIRRMLRTLKRQGFKLGIVTGKPEFSTRKILSYFGIDRWMDALACAADHRAEKDHLIRQALPETYAEAWMVGDRCFDVEGGRKVGVHTIGVTYGYGTEEELLEAGAEAIAHSVGDITRIICPDAEVPTGFFLSVEGLDGSGKGTQIDRLRDLLDRYGFEVVYSREPGGSPVGEKIRDILLDRANTDMEDMTEAILYAASRSQHVRQVIRPALNAGKVVLCDRFVDSSVAYQGGGRQLGVDRVLAINAPAVDGTMPLKTVYLDIDHRTALGRRCAVSEPDRLEMEAETFHARVEDAYRELIRRDPERFLVVDASKDRDAIAEQIGQGVLATLMEAET